MPFNWQLDGGTARATELFGQPRQRGETTNPDHAAHAAYVHVIARGAHWPGLGDSLQRGQGRRGGPAGAHLYRARRLSHARRAGRTRQDHPDQPGAGGKLRPTDTLPFTAFSASVPHFLTITIKADSLIVDVVSKEGVIDRFELFSS